MNPLDDIASVRETAAEYKSFDFNMVGRRVIKISEEAGELSQAFLDYTSRTPRRGKTLDDVLEEAIDTSIVGLDIAFAAALDNREKVEEMLVRKLEKWKKKFAAKACD